MKFTPDSDNRQTHEYWLTWTITVIVGLELIIALFGFWEGKEQLMALRDQVRSLTTVNASLQASIQQEKAVTDVLGKQLDILREQEESRLAALRRRPRLVILSGGADLMNLAQVPSPCLPLEGRGDIAGCSISLENRGDAPLTHGRLRVWDTSGVAFMEGSNMPSIPYTSYSGGLGLPGSGIEVTLPTLIRGEPRRSVQIEVVLRKKQPVQLSIQIVGDEIGTINLTRLRALPSAP